MTRRGTEDVQELRILVVGCVISWEGSQLFDAINDIGGGELKIVKLSLPAFMAE